MKVPYLTSLIFNKVFFQKLFAYSLFVGIAYFLKDFLLIFFLAFIFSYLFLNLGTYLHTTILDLTKKFKFKAINHFFTKYFGVNKIILLLYVFFVVIIAVLLSNFIPKIITELSDFTSNINIGGFTLGEEIKNSINETLLKLKEINTLNQDFRQTFSGILTEKNYQLFSSFIGNLKSVGVFLITFLVSLILSYIFIIDRDKISKYLKDIKNGNFAFIYNEYESIFKKISNSFGLIFKAQSIISFVNTILTIIGLVIIGIIGGQTFPYLLTLALFVFVAGFIPVLGLFISSIPILIVGYISYPGMEWQIVVGLVIMITFIHMIEAYYLNPKIVSSYMKFPMSMTLLILIVSEHMFGVVGFLIGVPIFYLAIDVLKDINEYITKIKISYKLYQKVNKEKV